MNHFLKNIIVLFSISFILPSYGALPENTTGKEATQVARQQVKQGVKQASLQQTKLPIIQSDNDKRDYEYLILPNKLRVLLVSDPQADQAAAAMSIDVGSTSNPAGREGLAHFLEHMLFMGTEKYPDVDGYASFISTHGGTDNAFTSDNQTTYFFDIKAEQLEPALDRFAQFFIAPLFDAGSVEREANAVQSEYQLKLKEDSRRIEAASKQGFNRNSPYSRFFTGSLETLTAKEKNRIREELLGFYEAHYSANIMGLTVVGKESLSVLRNWVEEKFSAVVNRQLEPNRPAKDAFIYQPSQLPQSVNIKPLKALHKLTLNFPIPAQREHYKSRPMSVVSQFIHYEGKGSLYDLLRSKGWVTALSSEGSNLDDVQSLFQIEFDLTEEGIKNTSEIILTLFQYIDLIKAKGLEDWRYEELNRKSLLDFRFRDKASSSDYAMVLSEKLLRYPAEDILQADQVLMEWKPGQIKDLLDKLAPQKMAMILVDPELETDQVETYYQVPYRVEKIGSEQLSRWENREVNAQLALPGPNPFLPEKAELKPVKTKHAFPVALIEKVGRSLWHQQDDTFGIPKAVFVANLKLKGYKDTASDQIKFGLLKALVDDELNAWANPAQAAGLGYSITPTLNGLTLIVYGYDEKQPVFLEKVLEVLKNPALPSDRFALFKTKLARKLANKALDKPYLQLLEVRSQQLISPSWSPEQQLAAMDNIDLTSLRAYSKQLFDTLEVELLTYGNLTEKDARAMSAVLDKTLLSASTVRKIPDVKLTIIPKGKTLAYDVKVDHPDSSVVIQYQGNTKSLDEQARWRLLSLMMAAPMYNSLRTEQQLGYIVSAVFGEARDVPGLLLVVQSNAVSASELQQRMEAFVQEYAGALQKMDEQAFSSYKDGLMSQLLKTDDTMLLRATRYLDNLEREQYGFDFKKQVAKALQSLTKSQLLDFYQQNVLREPRRMVVSTSGSRFSAE